jgi:hypothetical protein
MRSLIRARGRHETCKRDGLWTDRIGRFWSTFHYSDLLDPFVFLSDPAELRKQRCAAAPSTGYPQGLSGKDILLEARIICVADVVEAMASHRPYRPSMGIDVAMEEISKNRGVLYDPDVVDACLLVIEEQGFAFK